MRKFIQTVVATSFVAALSLVAFPAHAAKYDVDSAHSAVLFKIKHLNVSYSFGQFKGVGGEYAFDPENPEVNVIEMLVDIGSIDTANKDRDEHLEGDDYFKAETYPTAEFKSTSWKKTGDMEYEVTGEFTLLGVTKTITVPVEHVGSGEGMRGEYRSGLISEFFIKRSDYGMDHMLEALGDEVKIVVSIEGIRQ